MYAHYIKYELKTARGKLYDENCMVCDCFSTIGRIGPMVTRYTGRVSQLPVVEMNWEKKFKKKPIL